jgi:hypothetical protein
MEKYATPRISLDEVVFVTGGGKPTFYSQPMKAAYQQATGKSIPLFTSTSGSYNTEQRQFIEFAKGTIRNLYQMMENTAKTENPNTLFGALVDTYWVYPKTSNDTQPYDYYATVDEVVYEWFYAIRDGNWAGITDGLRRIKNLNPSANHYFIYGTSTMTSITNMRKSVELAMAEDYYGVFLYEYAESKSRPFDVSDIVLSESSSEPSPEPENWQYRKKITVQSSQVAEDLTNFPVLINVYDTDLRNKARADGGDIVFTDSLGSRLDHEIEKYESSTGHLVAWVKVPSLSSSMDTVLYMYYGNAAAENQENPSGVWDTHYMMVQHLNEPSGAHYDSTVNGNNGTPMNGVGRNATGKIDGTDVFDGSNDYVTVPHSPTLTGFTEALTVEAWIKMDTTSRRQVILNKWNTASPQRAWFVEYYSKQIRFFASQDGSSNYKYWSTNLNPVVGTWYYLTVVWQTNQIPKFYINGQLVPTTRTGTISSIYNNAGAPLDIGRSTYSTDNRYFDGVIDEVRISNPARSAEWISTCYNNQVNPSAFIDVGAEETALPVNQLPEVSLPPYASRNFFLLSQIESKGSFTIGNTHTYPNLF